MAAENIAGRRGYAKPVVVADRLDFLRGLATGIVRLPAHLKWSGNTRYDLSQPDRIVDLYRTVLNEAATSNDLHRYIDRQKLIDVWETIWLPPQVRRAWETRFPELQQRPETAD